MSLFLEHLKMPAHDAQLGRLAVEQGNEADER